MAQYFTDFSDVVIGDFTARWVTSNVTYSIEDDAGATGGKVLRAAMTSSARRLLSWNTIDSDGDRDDFEILIRSRVSVDTTGQYAGCGGRGAGSASSESGYATWLYDAANQRIGKYNAGSFSALASTSLDYAADTWYWTRFRVEGSAIKVKRWSGAIGDEPGTWTIETTDADVTAAGWVGLSGFGIATHEWDVCGVGTNGDTAPHEAVAGSGISHPFSGPFKGPMAGPFG